MTLPLTLEFAATAFDPLAAAEGRLVLLLPPDGRLGAPARRLDRAARGAVQRALGSKAWEKLRTGEAMELAWPAGLRAEAVQL
ncbi:MAG: leucyl aminopeptidase, partial [Albidovulum sp.]